MTSPAPGALDIARALIACRSVTPADAGALPYLEGLLRAAIVSRREPAPGAAHPQTPQAWFDRTYTVVTATNVEAFAAAAGKPPGPPP